MIKFKTNYPFDKKVQCERCGKQITLGQSMTGVKGIVCRECVEKERERMGAFTPCTTAPTAEQRWTEVKTMNKVFDDVKRTTYKPPMSNADHIRSMTDEELARYISGMICDINEGVEFYENPDTWLEWLKQPHKEG